MRFCKQIPGGNLFCLAGMKIDFPCNCRVKSVRLDVLKFNPGKRGSCNRHIRRAAVFILRINTFTELTGYIFYISILF